jgi:hypothetical protein
MDPRARGRALLAEWATTRPANAFGEDHYLRFAASRPIPLGVLLSTWRSRRRRPPPGSGEALRPRPDAEEHAALHHEVRGFPEEVVGKPAPGAGPPAPDNQPRGVLV